MRSVEVKASPRIKYIVLLVSLFGVITLFDVVGPQWPKQLFYASEFGTGDHLISQVESFRQQHGYLPETVAEMGLAEGAARVFYRRQSGDEYIVWFGTTLGESMIYNSRTKKWD